MPQRNTKKKTIFLAGISFHFWLLVFPYGFLIKKKFEAEGQEFVRNLRSLEQFIQTVKGQNNFW
jgi:hypothetical protein